MFANNFFCFITKNALGTFIARLNYAAGIGADDGIIRGIDNCR